LTADRLTLGILATVYIVVALPGFLLAVSTSAVAVIRIIPASTVCMVGAFVAPEGWLLVNQTFSILTHTASILVI